MKDEHKLHGKGTKAEIIKLRKKITDLEIEVKKLKQVEKALSEHASFRNTIIAKAAEGICVCHQIPEFPYVCFTVWNDCMTEITGYTIEDINRLGWYQIMYPDPKIQTKAIERMSRMRYGDDLIAEEWIITCADGQKRPILISTSLLESSDGQAHVLAIMQDIGDCKQAEAKRIEMERQLLHVQKLESLGVLAGGIAHDFNNLLMAILGNLDLALLELSPDTIAFSSIE